MKIHRYPTLPSTNTLAKEMIREGAREGVILAQRQTAGRGRLGRSFFSENGLFMSIILAPERLHIPVALLTSAAAASVCRVLCDEGLEVGIKWVNDLFYENKKVCGILTEAVTLGETILGYVVGIGLNLGEDVFPEELQEIAGVLPLPLTRRDALAQAIALALAKTIESDTGELLSYLKEQSIVLGKEIRYFGASEGEGRAIDLDDEGGLVVLTAENERLTLKTGEISLRLKNS